MSSKAFFIVFQSLSTAWTFGLASFFSQTPTKYFPRPWFILFNMVTDLVSSEWKVDGLIAKYASMASIHRMASSGSPEKCSRRAALISVVLVVVDMGFTGGGLTGGWGGPAGGCWTGGTPIGIAVMTGGFRVIRGVTGGKGFVAGATVWELGGRGVARFSGESKDAGLTVYCHPRTLFEDEEGSGGVLDLVGDCVCGVTARSRGFWEVSASSGLLGTWKTFLVRWGKILGWLRWSCS